MVVHDLNHRLIVEVAIGDPSRQLRVPDQVLMHPISTYLKTIATAITNMAMDLVAMVGGKVNVTISVIKGEVASLWLRSVPLLGVLRGDGVEIGLVLNDGQLLVIATKSQSSTDEAPSALAHSLA